jgi:RNA ligase
MTNLSTTAVWEVLSNVGSMDELLKDVPDEFYNKIKEYEEKLKFQFNLIDTDYKIFFNHIQIAVAPTSSDLSTYWQKVKEVGGDRAKFAHLAKEYSYPSLLFGLLDGKDISPIIWKIIKPEFKKL